MKIELIELRQIRLPLKTIFTTSFGVQKDRPCILVMAYSDGLIGYGECVAADGPWYSYETVSTAWHILRDYLISRLLGNPVEDLGEIWERFTSIRGHNMAKAALEMACWDLMAKQQGISLSHLIGSVRDRIPVGVSVGIQPSPADLVEVVKTYLSEGYKRIKLKIAPNYDLDFVAAVREVYPNVQLQVDANSAYTMRDLPLFRSFEDMNLLLIEQPLAYNDIIDHSVLQSQIVTPICLDESILSPDDARHAINLDSCRIINIKPGRVGGHNQSRVIHDLCGIRKIPVWCGGMLETNIGRAHNLALASLPGFTLPGDISASSRYYTHDIAFPDFVLNEDSTISVPTSPGIGVEPDMTRITAITERFESFKA